ncbi:hypothetical protein L9F63_025196, partial [Diploptera punctata]
MILMNKFAKVLATYFCVRKGLPHSNARGAKLGLKYHEDCDNHIAILNSTINLFCMSPDFTYPRF